ncbi:MAG: NTP transferase domain-containing protein, partial [Promethearchaeota archaeon]
MSLLWNDFINNLVVIILCAGEGRRMKEYSKEIPKPLLKISSLNNKTILQNTIEILKTLGIKETFVVKGHLGHLIDENIASLDKNITIIDSKEEYKKGPLNSFIEVLKSQNYQNTMSLLNEKGFFLVIPGDTIFESLLLHEILEQARKHQLEFKKIPLVFYRNLNPELIYNTKKQEINKITKKISIAVIQKNHPSN